MRASTNPTPRSIEDEVTAEPRCTIVVPTKDRGDSVMRLLSVLAAQFKGQSVSVIVVDDGSSPPVQMDDPFEGDLRIVRTSGIGPGAARNLGWRTAETEWVVFLDDDVLPQSGWWDVARTVLVEDGADVVEGRVVSEPFDWLYERSVQRDSGGWGLTCNVIYRKRLLEALDGFDEDFPAAHCEDLDLFFRAAATSRTTFRADMAVEHFKRPYGYKSAWKRGGWALSEVRLARKHPGVYGTPAWVPLKLLPLFLVVTYALGIVRDEPRPLALRRILRLAGLTLVQFAATGVRLTPALGSRGSR